MACVSVLSIVLISYWSLRGRCPLFFFFCSGKGGLFLLSLKSSGQPACGITDPHHYCPHQTQNKSCLYMGHGAMSLVRKSMFPSGYRYLQSHSRLLDITAAVRDGVASQKSHGNRVAGVFHQLGWNPLCFLQCLMFHGNGKIVVVQLHLSSSDLIWDQCNWCLG